MAKQWIKDWACLACVTVYVGVVLFIAFFRGPPTVDCQCGSTGGAIQRHMGETDE